MPLATAKDEKARNTHLTSVVVEVSTKEVMVPVTTVSKVVSVLLSISKAKAWHLDSSYTVLLNVTVLQVCQPHSSNQKSMAPTQKTSLSPAGLPSLWS